MLFAALHESVWHITRAVEYRLTDFCRFGIYYARRALKEGRDVLEYPRHASFGTKCECSVSIRDPKRDS